jgi:hypothetical protein
MKSPVFILSLLLLLPAVSCLAASSKFVIATPIEDTQAILHNPDMGWVLHENYPLDHAPGGSSTLLTLPGETFPAVQSVALMFSWFDIEKREGEYDFSKVDYAYDYWKSRGKQIQLRLSSESLLWWAHANPPSGQGIPAYVVKKLPPGKKQTRLMEGIPYVVADAREPFYRARLKEFLEATARHFSSTRPVTLVDLRGFGVWGEWHSGYQHASLAERHEALRSVIDTYAEAFRNHYLSLSYSYDPDGPKALWDGPTNRYDPAFSRNYQGFLHYSAFDYALSKPNITWRRDGAGGAVHSNERKLCEEAFGLQKGPMMCEFLGGYEANKKGGRKWLEWILEDALSLHPNYINLLGYQAGDALAFLKEQPELVAKGARSMGYRLVPTRVIYPSAISSGVPFRITMLWVNRGVGRALRDYRLQLVLTDEKGGVAATCDAGPLETANWVKGQNYKALKQAVFHNTPDGNYQLRLGLIDPATSKAIGLPIKGGDETYIYPLGMAEVRASKGQN